MFDKKDILARLQAGEDIMVIAQELSDVLNDAKDEYAAEQKRIEEEKKAAEAKAAQEREAAQKKEEKLNLLATGIVKAIVEYYELLDPELKRELVDVSAAEVRKTLDSMAPMLKAASNFMNAINIAATPTPYRQKSSVKAKTDDEIIREFLNDFRL